MSKAFLLLAALLCVAATSRVPIIEIKPEQAFVDESVKISLRDFPANHPVTVRACATNFYGQKWESHTDFPSDSHGRVNLTTQDTAKLFWSMSWAGDAKSPEGPGHESLNPINYQITADVDGQAVATAKFQRLLVAPGVTRIPVHDGNLRGAFFVPAGKSPHPAVIVLGGSEGGLNEMSAAFLASKGFASLALAYFSYEDLPKSLDSIPLEYFETAIHWLDSRKEVRNHQIAVMGGSRGGELALLLGATFLQIKAVVAISPSGVIWDGMTAKEDDPSRPAWTYQGQPLPHMSFQGLTPDQQKQAMKIVQTPPFTYLSLFQMMLENREAVEKATIPVEKINGPVLLISGDDDQLWPSTLLSDWVMERLKHEKHPYSDRHLAYKNAGHLIPLPNLPATVNKTFHPIVKMTLVVGGAPEPTAAASTDSWNQIVKFLHKSLQ